MRQIETSHNQISFKEIAGLPGIDLRFSACRTGPETNFIDIIDFSEKTIDRWSLPVVKVPKALEMLRQYATLERLHPGLVSHEAYYRDFLMRPHVAHLSESGKLFVCLSDNYNGFCICIIDTAARQAYIFPDDFENNLMCYTSTGDFSGMNNYWNFIRWPFHDTLEIINSRREAAVCEIGRINTTSLENENIYTVSNADNIHQITCSPDGRYAVFSAFKWELGLSYPVVTLEEDPEGYRRSHFAGMKKEELVTVDLISQRHWRTEIPVPAVAHFEFDPAEPDIFYLSAHNICPALGGVMVEGPAAVFKMRIKDGCTVIEGSYSDARFFRIRQHAPFRHRGRTIIAVTNFPNFLDLIDADDMTLWRRIELFSAPLLDLSITGNALCPVYPESCFYVNPAADGNYIILGSSKCFFLYDVENDKLLDVHVPLCLPEGCSDAGHTRSMGE